jgi:RNA polymerase sigma-70 factor (ECF subfamily)
VAVPVVANAGRGLFARALDLPSATPAQACPVMTEQAFQRLYDATSAPILGYLTAVTGHRHIAEDLLQETFIRLLARPRPSMNADETRRYLFRIATNLLRDRWRRNDHQPFTEPVETGQSPRLETSIDIRATLQRLKPRERELLWLAYVEGMDHREIAAATGLQPLSIRLLLHRARKKAAVLLQPGSSETRINP